MKFGIEFDHKHTYKFFMNPIFCKLKIINMTSMRNFRLFYKFKAVDTDVRIRK
jgi:hypothetical protein